MESRAHQRPHEQRPQLRLQLALQRAATARSTAPGRDPRQPRASSSHWLAKSASRSPLPRRLKPATTWSRRTVLRASVIGVYATGSRAARATTPKPAHSTQYFSSIATSFRIYRSPFGYHYGISFGAASVLNWPHRILRTALPCFSPDASITYLTAWSTTGSPHCPFTLYSNMPSPMRRLAQLRHACCTSQRD